MEAAGEAQVTPQCLNPHAQEFRPSSNRPHSYNFPNNYYPLTTITAFLFPPPPPPPPAPPVLLPHQHFPSNYPHDPYTLNTVPDHHYYHHPKPIYQNNPPPVPFLHPPPPPPLPAARPKGKRLKDEAADPSGSNICGSRGADCNYGGKRGPFGRKLGAGDRQGNSGNVHQGGTGRVWAEKKNKKWRRERKKEVMPVKPDGVETTVMIRNIPNQYTRRMLMSYLDEFCDEENHQRPVKDSQADDPLVTYDFVYLPMDFKTDANKGYAFVNFTHPLAVLKLLGSRNNQGWKHCKSSKICRIACATIQGKETLKRHFGRSRFMCNKDEYLPVCFSPPRDGSGSPVIQTTIGERVKPYSHR